MKNAVILKSYKDGLAVCLDREAGFDSLLEDVAEKFRDSAGFFGDMKVAVSFEGRSLTRKEEVLLVDAICANSCLDVVCVAGKDKETQEQLAISMEAFERYFKKPPQEGQFYRGNLTKGQILETEGSIVILGDVHPGGSVISTKDILVLGRLYGNAYAGGGGKGPHFIAALEMAPQKLKIGDFKYQTKEKAVRHGRSERGNPRIAFVKNGAIQMQAITNELPNGLPC